MRRAQKLVESESDPDARGEGLQPEPEVHRSCKESAFVRKQVTGWAAEAGWVIAGIYEELSAQELQTMQRVRGFSDDYSLQLVEDAVLSYRALGPAR